MGSKKSISAKIFACLKWVMQPEQLRSVACQHDKDFVIIIIWNTDRRRDAKCVEQVRDRVSMPDHECVAVQFA